MCSLKDKTVKAVNKAIGGKSIWVADRGFNGLNSYETWFSLGCNFVVRQRGDRHVVSSNGTHVVLSDLVEHMRQKQAMAHIRAIRIQQSI